MPRADASTVVSDWAGDVSLVDVQSQARGLRWPPPFPVICALRSLTLGLAVSCPFPPPPPPTNFDVPSWWVQRWPVYHPEFVVAEAVVVVVQQDGAMFSVLEFPKDAVYDADTVAAAVSKDAGVQVGASAGRVWFTGWV